MPDGNRAEPEAEAFRRRLLGRGLVIAAIAAAAATVAGVSGLAPIPPVHSANNALFVLVCVGLGGALMRWPAAERAVAALFLVALFVLITAAAVFIPLDPLRVAWYFPAVGAGFLIGGPPGGVLMAAGSAGAVILLARWTGDFPGVAVGTFVATMSVTATVFCVFAVQAQAQLRQMTLAANRDALTGIANRRAFETFFARVSGRPQAYGLLSVDVDHFKALNDTHGHAAGDAVLAGLAGVMRQAVRAGDLVARVGGEEFAVLLPGADGAAARQVAERIRAEVAATTFPAAGQGLRATVSIGVAVSRPPHPAGAAIRACADRALYLAKATGRNRVVEAAGAA